MSFWGELKRRNVYKVGVAYAIVAWLLIQFAAIAFPHLNFPLWAVPFVIIILIIGFPVVLIIAWAFEVTPDGIKRTKEVPFSESIKHLTGKKLNYILAGIVVLAIAILLFDNYYLDRRAIEKEIASIEPEQAPVVSEVKEAPKTIAVLPFDNLSSDPEQEYFVLGLSEEILNSLTQIPGLTVIAKTSSFSFKGKDKTIQEIANVLGVNHILEGSVRKAGDSLRITAQLIRAVDGSHLWSETYDKDLGVKEIFAVQEDIANSVADKLKLTLEAFNLIGGTNNVEAYELYLNAKGLQTTAGVLESLDAAIALDPEFALAWARKAEVHNSLSTWGGSSDIAASERDAAQQAAQKAIEIEPNLASGYFTLGYIEMSNGNYIEGELLYRKGKTLSSSSVNPTEYGMYGRYWSVGYVTKFHKLIESARRNDPLNRQIRLYYILSLGFVDDIQRTEEENELGKALFGSQWNDEYLLVSRICAGKILFHDMIDRLTDDEICSRDQFWCSIAKEYSESPEDFLAGLHLLIIAQEDSLSSQQFCFISLYAAYLRDPEFAMTALEKGVALEAQGVFWIWTPVMKEVRQLPRFKKFVREIGLVDYWNEFGWPDICHELDNGDFECD